MVKTSHLFHFNVGTSMLCLGQGTSPLLASLHCRNYRVVKIFGKNLIRTVLMISKLKKPFGLNSLYKNISAI